MTHWRLGAESVTSPVSSLNVIDSDPFRTVVCMCEPPASTRTLVIDVMPLPPVDPRIIEGPETRTSEQIIMDRVTGIRLEILNSSSFYRAGNSGYREWTPRLYSMPFDNEHITKGADCQ
jgi:hypothetical protein